MKDSALSVANYFVQKSLDEHKDLKPLKLMKLAYIAHGFMLAMLDRSVFNPQAPKYVLLHGTPKWKVFNQLPNKYNNNKYPLWHFSLPTLLTHSDNNE